MTTQAAPNQIAEKSPEYLLQEKWVLAVKRKINKIVGLIKAEYDKLTRKEGEKLFFIVYNTQYKNVIPLYTKNGIVVKGGLLDSRFIGKRLSEQKSYVEQEHRKTLTEINFISKNITENKISFEVKLNDEVCLFIADYKISKDYPTYFFIDLLNKKMSRSIYGEMGLSEKQKCALTYAAGYLYQQKFAPNKNINIR